MHATVENENVAMFLFFGETASYLRWSGGPIIEQVKVLAWFWLVDETLVLTFMLSV
jgi:hypothetical protein